jgi:FkbM family methyltransferase
MKMQTAIRHDFSSEVLSMPQATQDTVGPLNDVLTESVSQVQHREATALDELLDSTGGRCVIYGAGTLGRKAVSLLRETGIQPLAFVEGNSARWGTTLMDLPVMSSADAARAFGDNAVFFVTVWNDFHWFRDTQAKLTALGCRHISSYAPIFWRFGPRFMDLLLLNEPAHRVYADRERVLAAESLWADDESLATYRANVLWRAKGDPSHLPFPAPKNTYFPPDLFRITPQEVLVDCGAFDGDTIRQTRSLVGDAFDSIYAIEADTLSLEKMDAYLQTLPAAVQQKIHQMPVAVGETRCTIRFAMAGTLTSTTGDEGQDIDCVPLDELFADTPITFFKADIEGAEYGAVLGGRAIFQRDQPVLAVCVYHTQNDLWRLPLLVHDLLPQHKLFLRSYDGDGFQTVLYAVPPERVLAA